MDTKKAPDKSVPLTVLSNRDFIPNEIPQTDGPPPWPRQEAAASRLSAGRVDSKIVYEILPYPSQTGPYAPWELGAGRFAKVYRAMQRSDGNAIRAVAIKILHNTASYQDQNLFENEIVLLKDLSSKSRNNMVRIIDVVQLGPMIMCGCGQVYHPVCPHCGKHPLRRSDPKSQEYPDLACPDRACGYHVSAMNIEMQRKQLTSYPAKPCCREGAYKEEGTIINFVDRQAVVMELEEIRLDRVAQERRNLFRERCLPLDPTLNEGNIPRRRTLGSRQHALNRVRFRRAQALDKMMLMVQIAEAVAWLHQDQKIIHKDLTPDNVMVSASSEKSSQAAQFQNHSRHSINLSEVLNDLVSYPTFGVKIIDFGLSDREQPSRRWYEDKDVSNAGLDKSPYFSPEALQRSQILNLPMSIDSELKRFVIPRELLDGPLSVYEGDVVAFKWDLQHRHELKITRIEHDPSQGMHYAYFDGNPPPPEQQRQMQFVMELGEAHDIYSLGALFYYIFTENHLQVRNMTSFVDIVQRDGGELTARALLHRYAHSYKELRKALPIPDVYWQDRVMELILRAMVRGRRHSFNASRVQRGPTAGLDLLWETKRIYRGFQEQLLSESRVQSIHRNVAVLLALVSIVVLLLTTRAAFSLKKPEPPHPGPGAAAAAEAPVTK